MEYTVPALSIVFMILNLLLGIIIPVALGIYIGKKYHCKFLPYIIGAAVMIVFALVLEQIVHMLVLGSEIGKTIQDNIWLYGIYGGFMAGLFEESGRFIAMKTVLKKSRDNDYNALAYGVGHGGFEMFYILFAGMIGNLVFAVLLNTGNSAVLTGSLSGESLSLIESSFATLANTPPAMFLVSLLERLAALTAQLSLSVLVWFAAKRGGKYTLLYPAAIILHMLLDTVAVIVNSYVSNVLFVEAIVWLIALLCIVLAVIIWKKSHRKAEDTPALS